MGKFGINSVGSSSSASITTVPDEVYGSGQDGTVVISVNTTLTRDMYYNYLTINDGIHLNTAGYRVFVRNTLSFSSNSGNQTTTSIGLKNGSSVTGTLKGGSTVAATNSLGGASASYTVTAPSTTGYFNLARNAVQGYMLHASQTTPLFLQGGAGDGTNPGGGVVVVSARKVNGYGTIYATGYNNGSSNTTGGGVITYVSQATRNSSNIVLSVSGYAAGTTLEFIV
jgi:hypothetical protein